MDMERTKAAREKRDAILAEVADLHPAAIERIKAGLDAIIKDLDEIEFRMDGLEH